MEIITINEDIINISKELISAVFTAHLEHITKINLLIKNQDFLAYNFITKNNKTFEINIKILDLKNHTHILKLLDEFLKNNLE